MNNPVISVEKLSKSYRLGQIGTGTLSNDLKVWWARTRGKPNPLLRIGQTDHGNMDGETLWALRDVSFHVEQGEVLGIIGRNGAGKSTLLKILSRVTAPTNGLVKVKGRIASLLEVGTGFHPDLTGRENIYLNGAILGMTKNEVRRKFDEIVAFAEIEKFIDTPVKRYSSGMYVRLAFAVAAHLESEILLVDEVLAVGDAEFQKKCLGKMGDVATNEGRTVLFVSHNLAALTMLCPKSLLLNNGSIKLSGGTSLVIRSYSKLDETEPQETMNTDICDFFHFSMTPNKIEASTPVIVGIDLKINKIIQDYKIFLIIQDENSNQIVHQSFSSSENYQSLDVGVYHLQANLPPLWLKPGSYSLFFKLVTLHGKKHRTISPIFSLESKYLENYENLLGILNPKIKWDITKKIQI